MATIEICNEQDVIEVSPEVEQLVRSAVEQTLACEGVELPVRVEVLFVDGPQIRSINREQRDIDSETDVLSFPMLEFDEDKHPVLDYHDGDFDMDSHEILLGDIVLSLERALAQSQDFGHSFEREAAYLTVHSMLHLLGYDHEEPNDKAEMRRREEAVLERLDQRR